MITKVLDAKGRVLHDCEEIGCVVSWDGYVLKPAPYRDTLKAAGEQIPDGSEPQTGDPVSGREDPGDEWDTSVPGVARLKR